MSLFFFVSIIEQNYVTFVTIDNRLRFGYNIIASPHPPLLEQQF